MAAKSRKPAKKASSKKAAPRAAPKPKKAARKGKAKVSKARPLTRKAPKATARKAPSAPPHPSHVTEVRALVARPRPGMHPEESKAEHDHHDPRLAGIPGVGHEGDKVQVENYGQFKNKAVPRLDKPVNWFRRAPKSKS